MKSLFSVVLVLVLFLGGFVFAGELAVAELNTQPPTAPQGLSWNRFETQNFEILSINKADAEGLSGSVEFMHRWVFDRWGMKQAVPSVKCRIFICPDQTTMSSLFKKGGNFVRVDRDASGKIKALTIWCCADPRWHTSVVPSLLTEVALASFEEQNRATLPMWVHRGMAVLDRSLPEIRREVGSLADVYAQNSPCFWTADIMTMTADKFGKHSAVNQALFDRQAAAMCLYIMKTHGRQKFLEFLDASIRSPQEALTVAGHASHVEFDKAFNRYMFNVSSDIAANRTPNAYLTWESGQ